MGQSSRDPSELDAGFQELVRSYGRLIRAAISRVAGPEAERLGPDVEQRLLTELWKRYRKDDVIRHPSSYLYRAAIRETVRALRAEARTAESALDAEPAAPARDDPHRWMEGKELAATLDEEIEALLPERARAVRYHLAGFPVDEIMELQGWSYSRARNLIARGMAELRKRLRRRGFDGR